MMSWRVADNVLAYFMENNRWGEIAWRGRLRTVDRKEQSLCHGRHACQDAQDGIQSGQPVRLTAPGLFQGAELLAKVSYFAAIQVRKNSQIRPRFPLC
jgi:hypothetical protein